MKIFKNAKGGNEVLMPVETNTCVEIIQKSIKEKAEDCVDHLCGFFKHLLI